LITFAWTVARDRLNDVVHVLVDLGGVGHVKARLAAGSGEHGSVGPAGQHHLQLGLDALAGPPQPQLADAVSGVVTRKIKGGLLVNIGVRRGLGRGGYFGRADSEGHRPGEAQDFGATATVELGEFIELSPESLT
jgi:hypothetical protein